MAEVVVELFGPIEEGVIVDATFGGGGHARKLMESGGMNRMILGVDRDPAAEERARALGVSFVRGDFGDLAALLDGRAITAVDGVLFDFGISSRHVDDPERGFSFHRDGPLDMRMDPESTLTAADLVNELGESELASIISRLGEERHAPRIAAAIVADRPFTRTLELAATVAAAVPQADRRRRHPARKTFQALRMAVNHELESIERGLDSAIERLRPGGRCVTIAYHSLEDRIVKQRFAAGAAGCVCPPELPICGCGAEPDLRSLTRGALRPTPEEIAVNPRARSARLRAVEKAGTR